MTQRVRQASPALKSVATVGIMSFSADFTDEGSRSSIGPYLGILGVAFAIAAQLTAIPLILRIRRHIISEERTP